ncbi:response regulator [Nocardioides islandensis]|uniref:Response regulator n=1 Tax=Nocardioides islandensis TaxID=433663 RepID=A0A930VGY4_9ACTN|nr:response regulator [Nocardioides islandensis]MBF4764585.1 response regulator [Nocardioides islandensis]
MAWTVLIVDDHAGFRASARALLEADGFHVVGEADDGPSALEQARRLHPQVVLLDVQLPGMDGFAVADELAAQSSAPTVVLISSRGRGTFRGRLATTSARGFITKAEFSGECLSQVLS